MKIFYKINDNHNQNYVVKHIDRSFGSDYVYFDFQVALTSNRSFILNFDLYSKQCVSCEGYLLIDKKTNYENIIIEKYKNGELLIKLEEFEKEVPFCEYLLDGKIKYDINKSRICIGNINNNEIIMFGKGQYASFQNGKLIGIIVDFKKENSSIISDNLKENKKAKIQEKIIQNYPLVNKVVFGRIVM